MGCVNTAHSSRDSKPKCGVIILYLEMQATMMKSNATFCRRRKRRKHAIQMRKMEQQAAALVAGAVVPPNKVEDKRCVCIQLHSFFKGLK